MANFNNSAYPLHVLTSLAYQQNREATTTVQSAPSIDYSIMPTIISSRPRTPAVNQTNNAQVNPFLSNGQVNPFLSNARVNPLPNNGQVNPFLSNARVNPLPNNGQVNPLPNNGQVNPFLSNGQVNPPVNNSRMIPVNNSQVNPVVNHGQVNPVVNHGQVNPVVNQVNPVVNHGQVFFRQYDGNVADPIASCNLPFDSGRPFTFLAPTSSGVEVEMATRLEIYSLAQNIAYIREETDNAFAANQAAIVELSLQIVQATADVKEAISNRMNVERRAMNKLKIFEKLIDKKMKKVTKRVTKLEARR